jgi:hypothetical protein
VVLEGGTLTSSGRPVSAAASTDRLWVVVERGGRAGWSVGTLLGPEGAGLVVVAGAVAGRALSRTGAAPISDRRAGVRAGGVVWGGWRVGG